MKNWGLSRSPVDWRGSLSGVVSVVTVGRQDDESAVDGRKKTFNAVRLFSARRSNLDEVCDSVQTGSSSCSKRLAI
jgi:hypothetical protein